MTTIALPILVMLMVILLLIIINMILWQRQASVQQSRTLEIEERLERLGQALQELEKQNAQMRQDLMESRHNAAEPLQEDQRITPQETAPAQKIQDAPAQADEAAPQIDAIALAQEPARDEDGTPQEKAEAVEISSPSESGSEKTDDLDKGSRMPNAIYNIGKSGKIYTEEELELLIKE